MNKKNINKSIISQILASLSMLKNCIDSCPNNEWNENHNDYPFCQIIFHVLFDCDYSLCDNEDELKEQDIHKKHIEMFGDYKELMDRIPTEMADKKFINEYYEHCKNMVEIK